MKQGCTSYSVFLLVFGNACQRRSWSSRKFSKKCLTHICGLKASLELPSEALCEGISGSNVFELSEIDLQ